MRRPGHAGLRPIQRPERRSISPSLVTRTISAACCQRCRSARHILCCMTLAAPGVLLGGRQPTSPGESDFDQHWCVGQLSLALSRPDFADAGVSEIFMASTTRLGFRLLLKHGNLRGLQNHLPTECSSTSTPVEASSSAPLSGDEQSWRDGREIWRSFRTWTCPTLVIGRGAPISLCVTPRSA